MFKFTIGRDTGNDVVISDPTVSSWHAALYINNQGLPEIEDLQSRNGTFVNNQRVTGKKMLKPGDRVVLGKTAWDWEKFLTGAGSGRAVVSENGTAPAAARGGMLKAVAGGVAILLVVFGAFGTLTEPGRKLLAPILGRDSSGAAEKKPARVIKYDISCLRDSSASDRMIGVGSDIEDEIIRNAPPVPLEDEVSVGEEVLESIRNQYTFLSSGPHFDRVKRIMNKLVPNIDSARGFRYTFYVVQSDDINAFTAGGKVFVFTGILDFAKSDDEVACVLGHEIYHNELGHINKKLRKHVAMKKVFGDQAGIFAQMADALFGQAFNQDEETLCDLHGLDLAMKIGYKGCSITQLWERMAKDENPNEMEKWFRSHPYGKQRAACIRHHIKTNYDTDCQ